MSNASPGDRMAKDKKRTNERTNGRANERSVKSKTISTEVLIKSKPFLTLSFSLSFSFPSLLPKLIFYKSIFWQIWTDKNDEGEMLTVTACHFWKLAVSLDIIIIGYNVWLYKFTNLVLFLVPCGVLTGWMEFYSPVTLLYVAQCLYQQH